MGRHSAATKSQPASALWSRLLTSIAQNPWRIGLFSALAAALISTIAGLVILWPNSPANEHASAEFQQTYTLNHPQVEGTVDTADHSACQSEQTGQVFDTPPLIPGTEEIHCDRALVKITSGEDAGHMTQLVTFGKAGDPQLETGDKIVLSKATDPSGAVTYAFADYQRTGSLILWAVIVTIIVIAFGAWQGVRAIVGLAFSLGVVFAFLLPALIDAYSPLWTALVSCAAIVLVAVPLVHGANWKAASAVGGSLLALIIAAFLAWATIDTSQLQGYSSEDNLKLLLYMPGVSILGVLLCGFVVGSLGSLADVAVGQASTVTELHEADPDARPRELFLSAMKVGRDHIASMIYTLILTYTGATLPLLLLITAAQRPASQMLTSDLVATELLRSGVGAMALILAVPITTLIAAFTIPHSRVAD